MKRNPVPVYDKNNVLIGFVSKSTTSIGAAKMLGKPVQFSVKPQPCWRECTSQS